MAPPNLPPSSRSSRDHRRLRRHLEGRTFSLHTQTATKTNTQNFDFLKGICLRANTHKNTVFWMCTKATCKIQFLDTVHARSSSWWSQQAAPRTRGRSVFLLESDVRIARTEQHKFPKATTILETSKKSTTERTRSLILDLVSARRVLWAACACALLRHKRDPRPACGLPVLIRFSFLAPRRGDSEKIEPTFLDPSFELIKKKTILTIATSNRVRNKTKTNNSD